MTDLHSHIAQLDHRGWIDLVDLEDEQEVRSRGSMPAWLHSGEAVSLAIAASRGWRFLTDDRPARAYAATFGVVSGGNLGILLALVEERLLTFDESNALMTQMIRAGYRSPVTDPRDL